MMKSVIKRFDFQISIWEINYQIQLYVQVIHPSGVLTVHK